MNDIELYLEIFIMGSALLILIMTLISYRQAKSHKLLIISAAFILFFTRGLLLFLGNFIDGLSNFSTNIFWLAFDSAILLLIYLAIIRR